VSQRVDFSANSRIYDRRHGAVISDELAGSLAGRLRPGATVIDIGAGTGRVAVALAGRGLHVIATDPSLPMLQAMRRKSAEFPLAAVAADGPCLPFRSSSADAVVVARLLYLVADWPRLLHEVKFVLKRGGILFHEWGNGDAAETWVQVREKAKSLCREAGAAALFHPGASSEDEVDSCLRDLGLYRREQIDAGPGPAMTLDAFLDKIQSGEFSYLWNVPKDIQDGCLRDLRRWCEARFDLHRPVSMPAALRWVVYENVA
jgi:SAM-dependent methyltransferase